MATTVQFRKPVDPELDLTTWFLGKTYTVEKQTNRGACVEITLTEDLDAAAQTALAADLRAEITDPVVFL